VGLWVGHEYRSGSPHLRLPQHHVGRALREPGRSRYPDVQLGIGVLEDGEVVLDFLRVPRTERGKGTGSKILDAVCARADLNEWTVLCRPTQAFGGDLARLGKFFGRYGFRPMTDSERQGKDGNTWARWPEGPFA